jgi:hypothetical protein
MNRHIMMYVGKPSAATSLLAAALVTLAGCAATRSGVRPFSPDEVDRHPVKVSCPGWSNFPGDGVRWGWAEFTVTETGEILNPRPWRPPAAKLWINGPQALEAERELNQRVAEMALKCIYEPALKDGVPVPVWPVRMGMPIRMDGGG